MGSLNQRFHESGTAGWVTFALYNLHNLLKL